MKFVNLVTKCASPSVEDVRAALARLTENHPLASSPRLQSFLSFVVKCALAGKSDSIKEYAVATQALGRSDDFDPSADAIVRVEASRLRKALAFYYEGEGLDDPIVISMPVGSYAPSFTMRIPEADLLPSSAKGETCVVAEERRAHIAQFRNGITQFKLGMAELKSVLATSHSIMAQSEIIVTHSRGGARAGKPSGGAPTGS